MSAARDLAWVFEGPGLLADGASVVGDQELAGLRGTLHRELEALARNPEPLERFLAERQKTGRLGEYFENLLAFAITRLLRAERFAFRLPVREGGRTLGEFDLVFAQGAAVAEHWEASVKFYLCAADSREARSFVGTEVRDRLDLKLASLENRQLKLSEAPTARAALDGLGFGEVRARALVKGMLFYPFRGGQSAASLGELPSPPEVSPRHARGWWCDRLEGEVPAIGEEKEARWVVLPKSRWLAPAKAETETFSTDQLRARARQYFEGHRGAFMAAQVSASERLRVLWVDPEWQDRAQRSLRESLVQGTTAPVPGWRNW